MFDGTFVALHLPSLDVSQSEEFFVDILGGTPTGRSDDAARVRFTNFDIVAHADTRGATPKGREYPHYAFGVTPGQFVGIKKRLDAYNVPTNHPWIRNNAPDTLMYFRDPSGNQFELFAPGGLGGLLPVRMGARAGGDYVIDFDALTYDGFTPPASDAQAPVTSPLGFNHLTMPVRDLALGKRFLVEVLDGIVEMEIKTHVTVTVAGSDFGIAPQAEGYTPSNARYPALEFGVPEPTLTGMKQRFHRLGIPTSAFGREGEHGAFFFFRDPSGNMWKLSCLNASSALLGSTVADATVDVTHLDYAWT